MNTAFLFPGQGPQDVSMFAAVAHRPSFRERYPLLCDVLGHDPLQEIERSGPSHLNRNEVASAATVFISTLELDRLRELGIECSHAAGYSVGQWTAMYAAGMLSIESVLRFVVARAELMSASPASEGAMLAVIGLPNEPIEEVCRSIEASGDFVAVSNYNCLGQVSLAGTRRGIERAQAELAKLSPRKLALIPVAGAWHCRLLEPALDRFARAISDLALTGPAFPVADNVTGEWLPEDPQTWRHTLALHLSSPVRWEACVKRIATEGAERFIEVGFGDMLTKFGFFIDRKRQYLPSSKVS